MRRQSKLDDKVIKTWWESLVPHPTYSEKQERYLYELNYTTKSMFSDFVLTNWILVKLLTCESIFFILEIFIK